MANQGFAIALLRSEIGHYKRRFQDIKRFKVLHEGSDLEEYYRYSLELVFVRAKFLFLGILDAVREKNSYAAWAILKTFWETVALLGYLYVGIERFIRDEDARGALEWLHRSTMVGRYISKTKIKKQERQPRISEMLKVVQNFITRRYRFQGSDTQSKFYELYNMYVAEMGHATGISLGTCVERPKDDSYLANPLKSWNHSNKRDILLFLAGSSYVFFNFWDLQHADKNSNIRYLPPDDRGVAHAKKKALDKIDIVIGIVKAENFVRSYDCSVKKDFLFEGKHEHMWVEVSSYKDGVFYGKLGSVPTLLKKIKFHDSVEVNQNDIEDWLLHDKRDDTFQGGFSVKG